MRRYLTEQDGMTDCGCGCLDSDSHKVHHCALHKAAPALLADCLKVVKAVERESSFCIVCDGPERQRPEDALAHVPDCELAALKTRLEAL